jgi:hemoglobin
MNDPLDHKKTLFEQIGLKSIQRVVKLFYDKAFEDVLIGHFFFHANKSSLVEHQTHFATAMLGGPNHYVGKPLRPAHAAHKIRLVHFKRRQVLMRETLLEVGVAEPLAEKWLALEDQLKPVILTEYQDCR